MRSLVFSAALLAMVSCPTYAAVYTITGNVTALSFDGEGAALSNMLGWSTASTFTLKLYLEGDLHVTVGQSSSIFGRAEYYVDGHQVVLPSINYGYVGASPAALYGSSQNHFVDADGVRREESLNGYASGDRVPVGYGQSFALDEKFFLSGWNMMVLYYSVAQYAPYYQQTGGVRLQGNIANVEVVGDPVIVSVPVPEPTSWAMIIAGFFTAGGALRRRKGAAAGTRYQMPSTR